MDVCGRVVVATTRPRLALGQDVQTHRVNATPVTVAITMIATRVRQRTVVCGREAIVMVRPPLATRPGAQTLLTSALLRAVTTITATRARRLMGACGRAPTVTVRLRHVVGPVVPTPPASAPSTLARHGVMPLNWGLYSLLLFTECCIGPSMGLQFLLVDWRTALHF
jgi:hypothetical protein